MVSLDICSSHRHIEYFFTKTGTTHFDQEMGLVTYHSLSFWPYFGRKPNYHTKMNTFLMSYEVLHRMYSCNNGVHTLVLLLHNTCWIRKSSTHFWTVFHAVSLCMCAIVLLHCHWTEQEHVITASRLVVIWQLYPESDWAVKHCQQCPGEKLGNRGAHR